MYLSHRTQIPLFKAGSILSLTSCARAAANRSTSVSYAFAYPGTAGFAKRKIGDVFRIEQPLENFDLSRLAAAVYSFKCDKQSSSHKNSFIIDLYKLIIQHFRT